MSWSHHVTNVCRRISYYLYLLRSHCHVIDYSLMNMLLEVLVLSHLSYCVAVCMGSIIYKYSITKASENAEPCNEAAVLWPKEI